MLQIKKYLLNKIAAAQTMTAGNMGGAANRPEEELKPLQDEYQQASLTNLDGNNGNVQVQRPSQKTPARNLTNPQKDYMMNVRDRIDEMRRYHQGQLHYDKNKYTSEQWSDYVNGLIKDPMYAKVTADGVNDSQLQDYQREMANQSLANFRKRYAAVDPNHEMLSQAQDIEAGQYSNYDWEDEATYRKNRGLESTYQNGVYLPKQYNQQAKTEQKQYKQQQQADYLDRYQRQDRSKANTLSSVNQDGTKTEWKYDNQGNRTVTNTKVNMPKPVNVDNDYWQSFANRTNPQQTALMKAQAQRDYRMKMDPEVGKAYDYFVNKGHIPNQFLQGGQNVLKPGTIGFEAATRFRHQQYNHMNRNNPTKLTKNPYMPNYMAGAMNYNFITEGAKNNKERSRALADHVYDPIGMRNNLKQR
jgi:YD repeat-containing protein